MKWRFARNIAGQSIASGFVAGWNFHTRSFLPVNHGSQREYSREHLAGIAQDVARGRANLSIRVAVEGFAHDVDESCLALQRGKQGDRVTPR